MQRRASATRSASEQNWGVYYWEASLSSETEYSKVLAAWILGAWKARTLPNWFLLVGCEQRVHSKAACLQSTPARPVLPSCGNTCSNEEEFGITQQNELISKHKKALSLFCKQGCRKASKINTSKKLTDIEIAIISQILKHKAAFF